MTDREKFSSGLRDMATFLESHPGVPTPKYERIINVFIDREELSTVARALGKSGKNVVGDSYFYLRKSFGPLCLDFNVPREQVCTRKVVGMRTIPEVVIPSHEEEIVEWDCDPILEAR